MRFWPDFHAAVCLKNRLHRESGEEAAEPISPQQYRRWHSSSSDSWCDTSKSWWTSCWFFKMTSFLLQLVSFTVDSEPLWPTGCVHRYITRLVSPAQCTCSMMYNHTTWLKTSHWMCPCSAHSYHPHAIHHERMSGWAFVPRCFFVLILSVCLSFTFGLLFPLLPVLCPEPLLPCGQRRGKKPLQLRQPRSLASSHRLWAQAPWRLPLLGDYRNHLPGGIRRQGHGALVLVCRGTRRWDHRESAIFTTVHSG